MIAPVKLMGILDELLFNICYRNNKWMVFHNRVIVYIKLYKIAVSELLFLLIRTFQELIFMYIQLL